MYINEVTNGHQVAVWVHKTRKWSHCYCQLCSQMGLCLQLHCKYKAVPSAIVKVLSTFHDTFVLCRHVDMVLISSTRLTIATDSNI